MTERSRAFDAARALAALHIVGVWHALDYSPFLRAALKTPVHAAWTRAELAFFFLASAWLLARRHDVRSGGDALRFWKGRIVRILPLYLLALALLPLPCPPAVRAAAAVGLNNFLPGIDGRNVPTLWFVSVLVVFYALFPLLRRIRGRVPLLAAAAAAEAAFACGAARLGWDGRLAAYFPAFAAGLLLAPLAERALLLLAATGAAAFPALLAFAPAAPPAVPALAGAGAVLAAGAALARIRPAEGFLREASRASMCAYLFHRPVYRLFELAGLPPDGPGRAAFLLAVCAPAAFLAGWLVQRAWDRLVRPRRAAG